MAPGFIAALGHDDGASAPHIAASHNAGGIVG
jgi:hypothetical protein